MSAEMRAASSASRSRRWRCASVSSGGGSSAALTGLLGALLCSDPHGRPDAAAVCAHPVVARTRAAMDAAGAVGSSPLAPVPAGFLAHVLGDADEAMD